MALQGNASPLPVPLAVPYLRAAFAAAKLHRENEALAWLERALALRPQDGPTQWYAAQLLQELGRDEDAVQAYYRAADLLPRPARALTDVAILLQELGCRAEAEHALDRALAADGTYAAAWYTRAETKKFMPGDSDVESMESLLRLDPGSLPPDDHDVILLHYALAKAHLDLEEVPRALGHLHLGSRRKRASFDYDPEVDRRHMAAIAAAFPAATVALRGAGVSSELPIFILGMPRSGTSLVEQILASHPRIHGGGETVHIETIVKELGPDYPGGLGGLAPARIAALAHRYLNLLSAPLHAAAITDKTRITDKMPYNFLHVGLIHALLPRARIIHCIRDPLDTCVSCYSKLFRQGHEFSYDLAELGRYYRCYTGLMAHWRSVVGTARFIEVEYESIVDDLEKQARRLIAFCGLPWSDRCLRFHETQRPVRTASLHQVRRPVYRGSVGRWRSVAGALAPLRDILGDLLHDETV